MTAENYTGRLPLLARVLLARLQSVLGTSFEYVVAVGDPIAMGANRLTVERTARAKQDPLSFEIELNPEKLADADEETLLGDLFHEWLHTITYNFHDAGEYRLRAGERANLIDEWEKAVYELERRLWPFVKPHLIAGPSKKRGIFARIRAFFGGAE